MSSATLLLAVTGGIFCGASLIGTLAILYLWWQSHQRTHNLEHYSYQPSPSSAPPPPPPPSSGVDPLRVTMPQGEIPSVPSPIPPPSAAGVRSGSIWLDGIGGIVAGQRIMISKPETLLGRSGVCDVQFHDPKVSRQHALLRQHDSDYYIQDMQSTGGTFVNGQRVTQQLLRDRDQVRVGDSIVVFRRQ